MRSTRRINMATGAPTRSSGAGCASARARGRCVIVGKGAHSPDCTPAGVARQLAESLERLQTDCIDVYFLHQDNEAVPVGEFIDALDAEVKAGRIRSFGGSNWRRERIDAANAYADAHGRERMRHVSNQFSLAAMVEPVWPGNVSAGDDASMDWLARSGLALFAWSAQARGFFGERRNAGRDGALLGQRRQFRPARPRGGTRGAARHHAAPPSRSPMCWRRLSRAMR